MKQTGTLTLTKMWGRDSDNSLVLYGVVRMVGAHDFPHTEPIYLSYIGDLEQTGEPHKVEIFLENEEGDSRLLLEDELEVKEGQQGMSFERQVLANMEYVDPGLYSYVMHIDGEFVSRVNVRVVHVGARAGE